MITHPEIYKIDSTGKTRVWYLEQIGSQYRTVAGILGGNLVTSEWTICSGKQGRDDIQQADFEVEAAYKHKLTREYHRTLDTIGAGAHFFKPMLAKEYAGWQGPCFVQPKLDGARCIATKDGLFSRQGKPFVSVPHIFEALRPIFEYDPSVVLDGELYNHDLRNDFGQIMSLVRQSKPTADDLARSEQLVQYHIYDMPSHSGVFSDRTYSLRVLRATRLPEAHGNSLQLVKTEFVTDPDQLDDVHANAMADGYEGTMVRLNQPYEQKRSKHLLKRKEFRTEEFEVVSIDEGLGNWSGVAKSVTCRLPDGRTFGAGIKGTRERAAELLGETHKEVTVRFFEYTPDGIPRFPVVIDFHPTGRTD